MRWNSRWVQNDAEYTSGQPRSRTFEDEQFLMKLGLVDYFQNPETLSTVLGLPCFHRVTGLQNNWKTIDAIMKVDYPWKGIDKMSPSSWNIYRSIMYIALST